MSFFSLIAIALILAVGAESSAYAEPSKLPSADRAELQLIKSQAEADLSGDILPFWTRYTLDPKFGGYLTVVDREGRPMADTDKYVVMQARMVWTLSAAYDHGIRSDRYKSFAAEGVRFITQRMWDPQYGGFYMSVHRDGTPGDASKRLYAQEFVLYGLSEYARVFHDKTALAWAERTWSLIQAKTADPDHGGYREDFDREWNPIGDSLGVGGTASGKTINVHMHLMEALTALVRADPKPEYKKALAELVDLIRAKSITKSGYAIEPFDRDWNPKPDGQGRMCTYYGHDVELAWLMRDAYVVLGRNPATVEPELYPLIDNALQYGFDWDQGGLASIGPRGSKVFGDPAYASDLKQKEWWEQAELLVALSTAYRYTGKREYLDAFEKEWGWVWRHQIDHSAGDWFTEVDFNTGAPLVMDKGMGGWKVCYHDGRALMEVSKNLAAILGEAQ